MRNRMKIEDEDEDEDDEGDDEDGPQEGIFLYFLMNSIT